MKNIFLGMPSHWLITIIISTIIFSCGFNKLHVTNFNLFIFIIFASIAFLIGFVIKTSKQKH